MKNIEFKLISTTSSNSKHIQVNVDNNDCGVLYLSVSEFELLDKILRYGQVLDTDYTYNYISNDNYK